MEQVGPDANADGSMDSVFSLFAYDPQSRLTDINRGDLDKLTHAFNGETSVWHYGYYRSAKLTSEDKPGAYSYVPAAARTISYSLGASGSNTEKLDQYVNTGAGQAAYDQNGNRTGMGGSGCRAEYLTRSASSRRHGFGNPVFDVSCSPGHSAWTDLDWSWESSCLYHSMSGCPADRMQFLNLRQCEQAVV